VAPGVTVVGLGPGDPALLTLSAVRLIGEQGEAYLRTRRHPAVAGLPSSVRLESFDTVYEAAEDFAAVYSEIAARLIDLARRPEGVIYAVPGDACVGEASVALVRQAAAQAGLPFAIIPGVSSSNPPWPRSAWTRSTGCR